MNREYIDYTARHSAPLLHARTCQPVLACFRGRGSVKRQITAATCVVRFRVCRLRRAGAGPSHVGCPAQQPMTPLCINGQQIVT